MSEIRPEHYSIRDAAKRLGVAEDIVVEHAIHHGLRVSVEAIDYLAHDLGDPSPPQFHIYCRLTDLDVREIIGKAKVWRPYLALFQQAISAVDGITPSRVGMWITRDHLCVVREDLDSFCDQQEAGLAGRESQGTHHPTKAVTNSVIIGKFIVDRDPAKNVAWWAARMRNAKTNGLVVCRGHVWKGRKGSTWYPDLVADWLVGKRLMTAATAGAILAKHFPDCVDASERLKSEPS